MQHILNKPLPGRQINFVHPLAKGIVGCWLMNEGGWRRHDLSPYANHGAVVCADGGIRRSSLGIAFDGTDDYVDCGNNTSLQITGSFTVECWLYPSESRSAGVVGKHNGSSTGVGKQGFYLLETDNAGTPQVRFRGFQADGTQISSGVKNMALNAWNHVIGIYNSSSLVVYVNTVAGTSTAITNYTPCNTQNLTFGAYSYDHSTLFKGTIGLVRIWNRTLVAQEIKELYINPYNMFMKPDEEDE